MGKYAGHHGPRAAAFHFSRKLSEHVDESKLLISKESTDSGLSSWTRKIIALPIKKCGPIVLGCKLDTLVQKYL